MTSGEAAKISRARFLLALGKCVVVAGVTLQACAQTPAGQSPASAAGGDKRVVIDKTNQMLLAYEGERLVFQSRVSTGRSGRRTPSGDFQAGVKLRMHYSRLYDNAPMPWSVKSSGPVRLIRRG